MNWLEILIIVLFILGILGISIVYILRRKQIKLIAKSIFKETKQSLVSFFISTLFFSTIIVILISSLSANSYYINSTSKTLLDQGYPNEYVNLLTSANLWLQRRPWYRNLLWWNFCKLKRCILIKRSRC